MEREIKWENGRKLRKWSDKKDSMCDIKTFEISRILNIKTKMLNMFFSLVKKKEKQKENGNYAQKKLNIWDFISSNILRK